MPLILIFFSQIVVIFCYSCPYDSESVSETTFCYNQKKMIDSKVCVTTCPSLFTAYMNSDGSDWCSKPTESSAILFELKFSEVNDLTSTYIASSSNSDDHFITPGEIPFNSQSQNAPLPTFDRGFYFAETSSITSNQNYIPALYFTLNMWIKPLSFGEILNVLSSSTQYIRIYTDDSEVYNFYALIKNSYDGDDKIKTPSTSSYTNNWHSVSIVLYQETCEQVKVFFYINGESAGNFAQSNSESRFPDSTFTWTIGNINNGNSFRGFIYWLQARADDTQYYETMKNAIECVNNQYRNGENCQDCDKSCPTWPWCIRSESCSICASVDCNSCDEYSSSICSVCATGISPTCCDWLATDCTQTWTSTGCSEGNILINGVCLYECPYGFGDCSPVSTPVISVDFNSAFRGSYGGVLITGTASSSYNYWNSPELYDPFPAKNRGLYFNSNSYLAGSISLSNTWSIGMWAYGIENGPIISHSSKMLEINYDGSVSFDLEKWDGSSASYTLQQTVNLNSWSYISYSISFTSKTSTLRGYINNDQQASIAIIDYVFRLPARGKLYIGSQSSGSFKGFIASFQLWGVTITDFSSYESSFFESSFLWSCDYNQYYDGTECKNCLNTCVTGCTRGTSCVICDDILCAACLSFSAKTCYSCVTNAVTDGFGGCKCSQYTFFAHQTGTCEFCDMLCNQCAQTNYFECTECLKDQLVGNICLYECPYGYGAPCVEVVDSVINESFDTNFYGSYGIFVTGSSSDSYRPFNNPESNDPYPAYKRGLYFDGSTYLVSSQTIYLSHSFSIGLWINAISSGSVIDKQSYLTISSSGDVSAIMENPFQEQSTQTLSSGSSVFGWFYLSVTIQYSAGISSITSYYNGVSGTSISIDKQIYRDKASTYLTIGTSEGGFVGFINRLQLWNSAITDFSSMINDNSICGEGLGTTCLWDCNIYQYNDENSCLSCSSDCSSGCRRQNSCNLCYDTLCETCSGFDPGLCDGCVDHAAPGEGYCTCEEHYTESEGSCVPICSEGCESCYSFEYDQCISCKPNYFLVSGMCLIECPSGYYSEEKCEFVTENPLSLKLQNLIKLDTITGDDVVGIELNKYPAYDINDPFPAIGRGYYFTPSSAITVTSFMIAPLFTVTLWIKPVSYGLLINKISNDIEFFILNINESYMSEITLSLEDTSTLILTDTSENMCPQQPDLPPTADLTYKAPSSTPRQTRASYNSPRSLLISDSLSLNNGWHNLAYTTSIINGLTQINFYLDGTLFSSQCSTTYSPYIDTHSALRIGSGYDTVNQKYFNNSFEGFLWNLDIYNTNYQYLSEWNSGECQGCYNCPSEGLCPDNCPFNEYLSSDVCQSCNEDEIFGCRMSESSTLCKTKECYECESFDGACTSCVDGADLSEGSCACKLDTFWRDGVCKNCDTECAECSGDYYFECKNCNDGFILVGSVCLRDCPYGFLGESCSPIANYGTTKVIDQKFDGKFQGKYGIFNTSSSSLSYQFFNSPENVDPIPAKQRGLYFSNGQYLETNIPIYISDTFTLSFWVYSETMGDIFEKPNKLTINSNSQVAVYLEDPEEFPIKKIEISESSISLFSWINLIFQVSYWKEATDLVIKMNNNTIYTTTRNTLIFRDFTSQKIILGKSSQSSTFSGFIYNFNLMNLPNEGIVGQPSDYICSPFSGTLNSDCLWSCNFTQYSDTSTCNSCDSCPNGCVRASSCNVCYDPLCSVCTGFDDGECTLCIENASGSPCACDEGYKLAGFSCKIDCYTGCSDCTSSNYYECLACKSTYYFFNGLCLQSCPQGLVENPSKNTCDLGSDLSLSLALQDLIELDLINGATVGSLNTNSYPTFDSKDPIPAIYRGYYFSQPSTIEYDNFKISPFFTITIWAKVTSAGSLIKKYDGSTQFLQVKSNSGSPYMVLQLEDSSTVTVTGSSNLMNSWHNMAFTADIANGNTKICYYNDGSLISCIISTNTSPFIDSGNLYIGGNNKNDGFSGFIWSVKIYNYNTHALSEWITTGCSSGCSSCPSELLCPNSCSFASFYSGMSCTTCSSSCTQGCRSSLTCRLCKQKECLACTSFSGACIQCITHASLSEGNCSCDANSMWVQSSETCEVCDNLCSNCIGDYYFNCQKCISDKILVGSVCLNECPTGFSAPDCGVSSSEVINEVFNGNFNGAYGAFITGADSSLYNFFNTPEVYDPVPAKQRGLHFSGEQYLESSTNIYLSSNFSGGFWTYVETNGDIFQKGNQIIFNANSLLTVILENPSQATTTLSASASEGSYPSWIYYSFTIAYYQGKTTINVYLNNIQGSPITENNYIFRDTSSKILLGKSSSSSFSGFLYSFKLWNIAITDFTSEYYDNICGEGQMSNCLWNCGFEKFYDGDMYSNCNSCSLGCVRASSCNVCDDILCSICSGFDTNSCINCVENASGNPCECNIGYAISADGLSCNPIPCISSCKTCTAKTDFQCLSCEASYYLIDSFCEIFCPTGYNKNEATNTCDLISSLVLYLNLIDMLRLDTVSGFDVGTDNTNVYPNWDANDPVPSIERGYYFNYNSLMTTSSAIIVNHMFTITTWVKVITNGYLLVKHGSVNLIVQSINGAPSVSIDLSDATSLSLSSSTNIENSWHYISIVGSSSSDGTSSITIFQDGVAISTSSSSTTSHFKDSESTIILGDETKSFSGYLWNMKIYNDNKYATGDYFTSGCLNVCSSCPSDLTCLSECNFDTYPNTCSSCESSCSKGCVSFSTCRLCKNKECLSCNTFSQKCLSCITNADFAGEDCKCNENTLWQSSTESCELCYSTCASCSTLDFTGCVSCGESRYKYENLCIQYCPTGYNYESNECVVDWNLSLFVFKLEPHQIKDVVYDSKLGIAVETGQNDQFYPFYDATDPIAAESRGYYFSESSYMQIIHGHLIFAPKFSIFTWIRTISGNGDLLVKQSSGSPKYDCLKLRLEDYYTVFELHIVGGVTLLAMSIIPINNEWTHLGIISDINSIPSQQISIYLNGNYDSSSNENVLWFEDLQSSYTINIGASYYDDKTLNNFYTGFLWDLLIYNTFIQPSLFISHTCMGCSICPHESSNSCLIDCDISEYWDGSSCLKCNEACSKIGCVRPDKNCNLCTDVICSVCDDYNSTCITCRSNAHLSIDHCECDDGFYWDQTDEKCSPCDPSCKSCTDENFMSCLTCMNGYYFINGLCLELCPLGYSYDSNVCAFKYEQIFDLDLNTLNGVIYDKKSLVPVLTGSTANFYKNYDNDDPIPAPLRGFYFNGNSSILHLPEFSKYTTPKLIMAPVFTYSIWFNPESSSNTLTSIIDSSRTTEFDISLLNSFPIFTINLKYVGTFSFTCENPVYLSEWNHLMIYMDLDKSGHSFANCIVNTVSGSLSDAGISYYKASQSRMKNVIGAKLLNSDTINYFQGFIYSIEIFNTVKDISYLALNQPMCSDSCISCLPTKNCIPNCSIDKYWIGSKYNDCSGCHNNCTFGCKDSFPSCNLCNSNLCEMCSDYKDIACTNCIENADNAPFCKCSDKYGISKDLLSCIECESNEYSNEGVCELCPSKCISCESNNSCSACIDNAEIFNGICRCEIGYNGTNECHLVPFDAYLAINLDNSMNLTFSDELVNDLSLYDVYIEIENLDIFDFSYTVEKYNETLYIIWLSTSTEIKDGAQVSISLVNLTHCVSKSNGLLKNSTLKGELYHYNPYSGSQITARISAQSSAVFKASTGVILALSFINPSPAGLWSTMNVLQIIYYLGLSNIPMSDSFYEIITNMNAMKQLPNIFTYFLDRNDGNTPFDQAAKFGYKSDILFLNAGCDITLLLAISASYAIVYLLYLIPYSPTSKLLSSVLPYYKYSIFLRFWIQAYLDIGTASLISLLYFSVNNPIQITSSLLSLASMTFAFITPIAIIKLSSNNLTRIQQEDKEYSSKWNSLFYEFKNDKGLISTQYYFVFFMRRLLYMINLALLGQHSETQISLNILLSFATVAYLIKYQPYNERLLQIANATSEIAILLLMGVMSASLYDVPDVILTNYEFTMAILILAVIGVQTFASVSIFIKVCYKIIKEGLSIQSKSDHKYAISTVQPEIHVEDLERPNVTQETELDRTAQDKQMYVISEEDEIIFRT